MSRYRRIVWNEGMLLTPQHFQQNDNYFEDLLTTRLDSYAAYNYGVLDLKLNRQAIANGNFQLVGCRAIFGDGLTINVPDTNSAPEMRAVGKHFSPEAVKIGVHLVVPAQKSGEANFHSSDGNANQNRRYRQTGKTVRDETTGENEQILAFAEPNLRIVFDDELRDGMTALKIAELERSPTGQIILSEKYIPPILSVNANEWLADMLRQAVEILIAKSSSLAEQRRHKNASLADFNTADTAVFWLLHTVNASVPTMAHLFRSPLVHPEKLYLEMAELAGRLMTFSSAFHPKDIVRYDHDNLYLTFHALFLQFRELLETVIPTRCVPIPLEKVRDTLYIGRVQDDRLLKEAAFYLAVNAQMPAARLLEAVPRVVKIASKDVIEAVIGSALPGVALTHQNPPPAPIPARPNFQYFGLDAQNPYWDGIKGSKVLAVYVPDEVPDEKLEMYAVKP